LSKSIIALETEYGVKLFDRHPRGLMPTTYGLALENHARRILLDIEQSKRDISEIASGAVGRVRVGVGQAFVKFVEDALVELENDFPNANNTVITNHAEGLRLALLENRIDMFLGMVNNLVGAKEFETTIVATDPMVGLCHKSHEFAGKEISLDQLRGKEWIAPERGDVARSALEAFFLLNQEAPPRFKMVTNIPNLLGRFVQDFQLLSLSPLGSFHEFNEFGLARFDIKSFKIRNFNFSRQIGIVRRAGLAPSPLTAKFTEILEASFKDLPQ